MLVVGGGEDYGVHQAAFFETAAFYAARPDIIAGMPHDMMLHPNWQIPAARILNWLTEQGL